MHILLVLLTCVFSLGCESNNPEVSKVTTDAKSETKLKVSSRTALPTKSANQALLAVYETQSKALLSMLNDDPRSEGVVKTSQVLIDQGVKLTEQVLVKEPDCKPFLEALLAATPTLHTLSAEAIELGYHQDGKLPKSPKDACHHAKDLIVHPATVLVLAKSKQTADVGQMKKEVAEVLAHLQHIKEILK